MTPTIFTKIHRFFDGTGHVLSTPYGDARGHVRMPIDTMYDQDSSERMLGH